MKHYPNIGKFKAEVSDINSSSVKRIEFTTSTDPNEDTGETYGWVRITFSNGQRYLYKDVPVDVFFNVIRADSIGSAAHDLIVTQPFHYSKVD